MKKNTLFILLFFFTIFSFSTQAQDVKIWCCENVDYSEVTKDMDTALKNIDSTTMLDLSLQTPKITTLPVEITQLVNLTYLNLSFNRVSTLPSTFVNLQKLSCLDLSGNHYLQNLPSFLNNMPNLKIIKLQDLSWNTTKQEQIRKQFPYIIFIF